jgi:hypothetical protein
MRRVALGRVAPEVKGRIMHKVTDYQTGNSLDGAPSPALIAASEAAEPTGAVCAYRDEDGDWRLLEASSAESYRRMGHEVRTVYVESVEDPVSSTPQAPSA